MALQRHNKLSELDKKWVYDLNQYTPKTKQEAEEKFECKIYKCVFEFGKSCASRWAAINIDGTNWGSNRLCSGCEAGRARYNLLNTMSEKTAATGSVTSNTVPKSKKCLGKRKSDGAPCARWANSNSDFCPIHFPGSL